MNVVNFGSLNLDHVYAVDHFCRAGETIHTAGYTQNAGGKGLNQSIAVARSGQTLCHAGMLGAGGEPLAQLLEGCGVDLRYLGRTETPQGHAIIQVQPDGQNCIFLYGGSNQAVTPEDIDVVGSYCEDHGPWSYTTVFAFEKPGHRVEPKANDDESMEIEWVPVDAVPNRKLLTAMRTDWPNFAARLRALAAVR